MKNWIQRESSLPEIFSSLSLGETLTLGERIGQFLEAGDVIALRGALGAGKTCLVKGIARYLNIDEEITSPTYTIVSEYEGTLNGKPIAFYHIDAYRLRGEDDFTSMGGEEYLYGNAITVVEWSERIAGSLPPETLVIDIEINGENARTFRITGGKQ